MPPSLPRPSSSARSSVSRKALIQQTGWCSEGATGAQLIQCKDHISLAEAEIGTEVGNIGNPTQEVDLWQGDKILV